MVCVQYCINFLAALECLRRKQLWTKQLESIDGILMNLDAQTNAFENARLNMFYLDATKKCTNTMEIINKSMYVIFISLFTFHRNIDMVHDLVDKTAEQQDITNEITTAISTPTDYDQFDMDELEKEFEMLTVSFALYFRKNRLHLEVLNFGLFFFFWRKTLPKNSLMLEVLKISLPFLLAN